mgnify:CR=1 FL=1
MSETIQQIALADLIPTPDNNRSIENKAAMAALVSSIESIGMIHTPVIARTHPTKEGKLDLRTGSRRLAAAKRLGLKTVPTIVREMTDDEAAELTFSENFHRDDLHPLEEAAGIRMLSERGWDAESIASKLGKTARWVTRRAKLADLIEPFRKMVCDPDHRLHRVPVGVIERMASLPPDSQASLAKQVAGYDEWDWRGTFDCVRNFDVCVLADLMHDLRGVPWKLDDVALHPKAGACAACPKRSICEPLLFDDLDNDGGKKKRKGVPDRCLDTTCFEEKQRRFLSAKIAEKRAEHKDLVLLTGDHMMMDDKEKFAAPVVQWWEASRCKKTATGAKPAVVVSGSGVGTFTWVKLHIAMAPSRSTRPRGADGNVKPKTMKQRIADLVKRRQAWAIDHVRELLEAMASGKKPVQLAGDVDDWTVVELIAAFGTSRDHYRLIFERTGKIDEWRSFEDVEKKPHDEVSGLLARSLCDVFAGRLKHWPQCDIKPMTADAKRIGIVLGVDWKNIIAAAMNAIPNPKSWANLKADGTPKSTGKRASKGATEKPSASKAV